VFIIYCYYCYYWINSIW